MLFWYQRLSFRSDRERNPERQTVQEWIAAFPFPQHL